MLKLAVANGGVKLDSYEGNHKFYIRNGFEPVSWCKWSDDLADMGWMNQDWLKANGLPENISTAALRKIPNDQLNPKREDIIFYRYTGKESPYTTRESFKASIPESVDYDAAKEARDKALKRK